MVRAVCEGGGCESVRVDDRILRGGDEKIRRAVNGPLNGLRGSKHCQREEINGKLVADNPPPLSPSPPATPQIFGFPVPSVCARERATKIISRRSPDGNFTGATLCFNWLMGKIGGRGMQRVYSRAETQRGDLLSNSAYVMCTIDAWNKEFFGVS